MDLSLEEVQPCPEYIEYTKTADLRTKGMLSYWGSVQPFHLDTYNIQVTDQIRDGGHILLLYRVLLALL